jgi:hypothetical protein
MAQKNNALIVFGSLVVIGSVGYYLWSKSKKSKGEGSSEPTPKDESKPKDEPIEIGKGTTIPPKTDLEIYLGTTDKVKLFQNWLDDYYPTWLNGKKLNKGSGWGTLGPNTKKAWNTYKNQYKLVAKIQNISDSKKNQQGGSESDKKIIVLPKIKFKRL